MTETLFKLAKAHQIEPLKQVISAEKDFDINAFFDEYFTFWTVEDIDFLGRHFDISVRLRDNAALIKAPVLDYFLGAGLKPDAETVEELLTLGGEEKLAVLMKHQIPIPSESIFMWPVFDRANLLKVYLENGGDPDVRDEDGQSLIDCWYSHQGASPAVTLLEEHGAVRSADSRTMKEKIASLAEFGEKMKDPEFARRFENAIRQNQEGKEPK